ncbi:MAG: hypothetical protein AAGA93_27430 [Actinomycetota bacterium]
MTTTERSKPSRLRWTRGRHRRGIDDAPTNAPRRAGLTRFGPWRDDLVRWWGCSWPNRLADRAGRYRRLAIGLAVLPAPLSASGVVLMTDPVGPVAYGFVHLVVACCCFWLAGDLLRTASVLDVRGRPHPSAVALGIALGFLVLTRPTALGTGTDRLAVGMLAAGATLLVIGVLLLAATERARQPMLSPLGRLAVIVGAILIGSGGLIDTVGVPGTSVGAVAQTASSLILLLTGLFEARMLARGIALFRVAARR